MKFKNTNLFLNGRTDELTDKPIAICPFNFFKVRCIKQQQTMVILFKDMLYEYSVCYFFLQKIKFHNKMEGKVI